MNVISCEHITLDCIRTKLVIFFKNNLIFKFFYFCFSVVDITLVPDDMDVNESNQIFLYEVLRLDNLALDSGLVINLTVSTMGGSAVGEWTCVCTL